MISLRRGSRRRTQCYEIWLGGHRFYVSYETLIGYDGPLGQFRRNNDWGPTTGRHMKEMGIYDYEVITQAELEDLEQAAVCHLATALLQERFKS